jgi:hypothetical protein
VTLVFIGWKTNPVVDGSMISTLGASWLGAACGFRIRAIKNGFGPEGKEAEGTTHRICRAFPGSPEWKSSKPSILPWKLSLSGTPDILPPKVPNLPSPVSLTLPLRQI